MIDSSILMVNFIHIPDIKNLLLSLFQFYIQNVDQKLMRAGQFIFLNFFFITNLYAQVLATNDICSSSKEKFFSTQEAEQIRSLSYGLADFPKMNNNDKEIENLFKEKGVEAFCSYDVDLQESLFESILSNSRHSPTNELFIGAIKKDQLVQGKNIYQIYINKEKIIDDYVSVTSFINGLNVLFPPEKNEDLKLTIEKFGLPWNDKNFPHAYRQILEQALKEIKDEKKKYFEKSEKEFERIINVLKQIEDIPKKFCDVSSYQKYLELVKTYGNPIKNSFFDIIKCLTDKGKQDIVQDLLAKYFPENLICEMKEQSPSEITRLTEDAMSIVEKSNVNDKKNPKTRPKKKRQLDKKQ